MDLPSCYHCSRPSYELDLSLEGKKHTFEWKLYGSPIWLRDKDSNTKDGRWADEACGEGRWRCERLKWESKHPTTNGNFRDGTKSSLLHPCRPPRTINMYHRIQSKNIYLQKYLAAEYCIIGTYWQFFQKDGIQPTLGRNSRLSFPDLRRWLSTNLWLRA